MRSGSRILRVLVAKKPDVVGLFGFCELYVIAAESLLRGPADTRDHLFVGIQPEKINNPLRRVEQNNPAA